MTHPDPVSAGGRTRRIALLHGVMSSRETWWRIAPGLERRGWTPVALDLPWHGEGPRLAATPDLEAFADAVAARLDGPVDAIVGHSLGALVALTLVRRHDTGAARLVLEEPPAVHPGDRPALAASMRKDAAAVRIDRDAIWRREREGNPTWEDGDVERSLRGIEMAAADVLSEAVVRHIEWDLVALLRAAPVPVHVLAARGAGSGAGSADRGGSALPEPERSAVRELLPAGAFVELPGGHCLHRDDAAAWLAVVEAALG